MSDALLKTHDLELLKAFKKAPLNSQERRDKLNVLLNALAGAIATAVNTYKGAPLPAAALELEGKRLAAEALEDFDEKQGVGLATFIITRVKQRLFRYVSTHQNVARLPEEQIRKIGPIREAMADLTSKLRREPTTDELADHLGLPVKEITRIRKNLRADLLEETGNLSDLGTSQHDPDTERALLVYYQLSQVEKQVFDYTLGTHGLEVLKAQDIAKKLNISPGRISQIKMSIATKIKPYLHE